MANEAQITVTRQAQVGGQNVGGTPEVLTADWQAVYRQSLAAGTVDQDVDFPITLDNVVVLALWSSQDIDVYTNAPHTGSYGQHLHLLRGATLVSTSADGPSARILSGDVTRFYLSNPGTEDATVIIAVAANQSPEALPPPSPASFASF